MAMDENLKKDMRHCSGELDPMDPPVAPEPDTSPEENKTPESRRPIPDPMPPRPSFVRPTWSSADPHAGPQEEEKPAVEETQIVSTLQEIQRQMDQLNQSVAVLGHQLSLQDHKFSQGIAALQDALESRPSAKESASEDNMSDQLKSFEAILKAVADKQDRNDRQIAQTLRENANFQIQVRQGMQRDLDEFKAQRNGEQFNPILKEIATIYVEYQSLLDEDLEPRVAKNLMALFEQMADLLADYEAEVTRTPVGEERQARLCKVLKKIPTGDQSLHNVVANSRKPGVVRGRVVLYPEFVDVYVYDPSLAPVDQSDEDPVSQENSPSQEFQEEQQPLSPSGSTETEERD